MWVEDWRTATRHCSSSCNSPASRAEACSCLRPSAWMLPHTHLWSGPCTASPLHWHPLPVPASPLHLSLSAMPTALYLASCALGRSFGCVPESGSVSCIWMSDVSIFLEVGYLGARPCLRQSTPTEGRYLVSTAGIGPGPASVSNVLSVKGLCYHHIGLGTYLGSRS